MGKRRYPEHQRGDEFISTFGFRNLVKALKSLHVIQAGPGITLSYHSNGVLISALPSMQTSVVMGVSTRWAWVKEYILLIRDEPYPRDYADGFRCWMLPLPFGHPDLPASIDEVPIEECIDVAAWRYPQMDADLRECVPFITAEEPRQNYVVPITYVNAWDPIEEKSIAIPYVAFPFIKTNFVLSRPTDLPPLPPVVPDAPKVPEPEAPPEEPEEELEELSPGP